MSAFPEITALANASEDAVLAALGGAGYYSRAHNLHKTAKAIVREHDGEFPQDLETLVALPGIGRSTAGAILALAHGQRRAILDGNARRVLARVFAVEGWPGRSAVNNTLWRLAESNTPGSRVRDYTQAIMDLGATVCLRRRPLCDACPLNRVLRSKEIGPCQRNSGCRPAAKRPLKCRVDDCRPASGRRGTAALAVAAQRHLGGTVGLADPGRGRTTGQEWCRRVLDCSPT